MKKFHVLALSGSLREASFNTALLKEATKLAHAELEIEIASIKDIPLYNKDVELQGFPHSVASLREKLNQADGLLIASPEHNYSIPGVLKNTTDWLSRPPGNLFAHKPTAIMGASDGRFGTVRAQLEWKKILAVSRDAFIMNKPEMHVTDSEEKFDADLNLTDERTRDQLTKFISSFLAWIKFFAEKS